jgi:prepilin signal peptidase PulO-like enzyme (type II secretory pathway)
VWMQEGIPSQNHWRYHQASLPAINHMVGLVVIITFGLFVFGAILASFITVISERVYTGQSWFQGRSRCNSCRRTLTGIDLIPVLSWLVFGGRCRTCRSKVPAQYAISEVTLGALFALSYIKFGFTIVLPVFLSLLCVLLFVVLYDIRHTIVPAWSSTAVIILGAAVGFLMRTSLHAFLVQAGVSVAIAFAFFLVYFLSRGRAMGLGDTPMSFGLALMSGSMAVTGVLFSFWIGAVIGIFILVMRRGGPTMGIEVPFVPFMAAGFLLALFTQWNVFPYF